MTARVEIVLGSSDEVPESVRAVAARLDVELSERGGGSGASRVGDRLLPTGAPTWQIEAALLRALRPRHVLFLCVANSARSQLAEGIARSLATGGVEISSAGSAPTSVRSRAVAVLAEIGIDISSHRSRGIDEVVGPVDTVITLCSEEVCPAWLRSARRLHWSLPDPAAVGGSHAQKLEAFREVRDELMKRLTELLGPRSGG